MAWPCDLVDIATGVRFSSSPPRRNGLRSIPIFLCRKISHTRRRSSSFAKRHARLACSLASALSGGSQSLSPFCDCACGANISTVWHCCVGTDFAPFRFFYCIKKSVTRAVVPPLSQKGTLGSTAHLQARSRRFAVAITFLRLRLRRRRISFI